MQRFLGLLYLSAMYVFIPTGLAYLPCYLIRHFLFALPFWVFIVSAIILYTVNFFFYPISEAVLVTIVSAPSRIRCWFKHSAQ
jgi:hypothetical protein